MRNLLVLILFCSTALLGTGAGQFAHEQVAHAGRDCAAATEHDHANASAGDHAADHHAADHHTNNHDDDAPPAGHDSRAKSDCALCQTLATLGKAQLAPPAAVALIVDDRAVLAAPMPRDVTTAPAPFRLAAAPRGPPVV